MSIIPSAAPNNTSALTPERLTEIESLLRSESSIAFYSARAKESMLLLLAEAKQRRDDRAAVRAATLNEAADFLSEIGTPIFGARSEHERGLMYGAERLRRIAADEAVKPVTS